MIYHSVKLIPPLPCIEIYPLTDSFFYDNMTDAFYLCEHIFRFSFEVKVYKAFPKVIIIGKHMLIESQYI